MHHRKRKLIGTFILVAFVIVYAFLATMLALLILPDTAHLVQIFYCLVAGILWAFPLMPLIKWMGKME